MSLSFTVHEMIFEKASASCREHSGYNLLDETAVRYGHPFTMVDVRCRGTVVRMGRRDGALFGTRTIRTLRGGSRCGGILIHLDGIRVSELAQGNIDFLTNPRRLGAVEVYTGAAQIRSDTMRPARRAA